MPPGNVAPYPQLSGPFSLREQYTGQPARVHQGATQVIGAVVTTVVKLDTVTFDGYASSFSTPSNGFVPPATGYYDIKAGINFTASAVIGIFKLLKNGVEISRLGQNNQLGGALNAVQMDGSDIIFGTPADLFTVGVSYTGAATGFLSSIGTSGSFLAAQQVA